MTFLCCKLVLCAPGSARDCKWVQRPLGVRPAGGSGRAPAMPAGTEGGPRQHTRRQRKESLKTAHNPDTNLCVSALPWELHPDLGHHILYSHREPVARFAGSAPSLAPRLESAMGEPTDPYAAHLAELAKQVGHPAWSCMCR